MLNRTLIVLGKPMEEDKWIVCLSRHEKRITIPCGRVEWADPCYGKELHEDDIKAIIEFLQQSLEEVNDAKSNVE